MRKPLAGTASAASASPSIAVRRRRSRCCDRNTFPSIVTFSQSTTNGSSSSSTSSSLILFSLLLWAPSSPPQFASSLLLLPSRHRCHQQHCQWRHRHRPHNYSTKRTTIDGIYHRSIADDDGDDDSMDIQPSTKSKSKRKMREGRFSSSVTELTSSSTTTATTIKSESATSSSSYARTVTKATTVNRSKSKAKSTTIFTNTNNQHRATMSTALCIVPPHHAWDVIQRARHMARDASFYRWPPAIRLFHPFVPHKDVPNAAGRLASWIDSVCEGDEGGEGDRDHESEECDGDDNECVDSSSSYLRPFEVTLDSILILPHWEILDARIEALEISGGGAVGRNIGRRPRVRRDGADSVTGRQRQQEQYTIHNNNYYHDTGDYYDSDKNDDDAVANSGSQEMEYRRRKAEGARLIEDEERKGIARKKERERKRRMRLLGKDGGVDDDINTSNIVEEDSPSSLSSSSSSSSSECGDNDLDEGDKPKNASSYNGPCVVYLSPDDASRHKLESLRERLRVELFPNYDAFSPGSSVSPYPECLPRPRSSSTGGSSSVGGGGDERGKISSPMSQFRPLLPIGRFSSVEDAVAVAKVLQSTWDPLTFNVTDIQFISRRVAHDNDYESLGGATTIAASTAGKSSVVMNSDAFSGGAGFGMSSSMKSLTTTTTTSVNRMAITTSGEVEDVSRQGIYGCDAMVMLVGEEPEEELMDIEASLALMMDDDDNNDGDNNDGCIKDSEIDYDKIFATAEREYRRMQSHEILSTMNPSHSTNSLDGDGQGDESDESTSDIEAWLDDDDESLEDEGATVVIGRAQFFMGANREFVGMPASSAIDSKDRIMGGGISAVARRKGSVHRLAESWNSGDYGKKESDRRA